MAFSTCRERETDRQTERMRERREKTSSFGSLFSKNTSVGLQLTLTASFNFTCFLTPHIATLGDRNNLLEGEYTQIYTLQFYLHKEKGGGRDLNVYGLMNHGT